MMRFTLKASLTCLTLAAFTANAQPPDRSHLKALSEAELKTVYLECDQLASTTFLNSDTAADCSMVAEELLERSFGGNFKQMLEWWRSARNECRKYSGCA